MNKKNGQKKRMWRTAARRSQRLRRASRRRRARTPDHRGLLQAAPGDRNRVRLAKAYVAEKTSSVFGRKKVEPEIKDDETPAAKEEGAKPAAPAAGGESR